MPAKAELFKALFENFPEAILVTDDSRRYVFANPAACELIGLSPDEIQKKKIEDFAAPHLRPQVEPAWQAFMAEGKQKGEYELARPDGSLRRVIFSAAANVMPGLHVSSLRDITEQRLAEAENEDRMRMASEAADLGMWVWDIKTGEVICSDKCKELFGLERTASPSYTEFLALVHPDDQEKTVAAVDRSLAGDGIYRSTHRVIWPDGSVHWLEVRGKAEFDANRIPIRLKGINLDITVRKRAEEALRRTREDLEAAVEQRTAALRILSARLLQLRDAEQRKIARELHDSVGQDLTSVLISLDLLARPQTKNREQLISDSRQTIERLLSHIRTLSHLLHPPLLDEAGLASATRWLVEGFARRSGVEINLELGPLPRLSPSTEVMLFRVLQECITNIHRHSGSTKADVRLVIENGTVKLSVRDYGRGIPQEKLLQFQQSGTGVGVGLGGIRERAKDVGANLDIVNADPGTLIKITVPAEIQSAQEGHTSAA